MADTLGQIVVNVPITPSPFLPVCTLSEKQAHWSSAGQWMNFGAVAAAVVTTFQQRLEGSMPLLLTAAADAWRT
jgi:hypothetical protein